MAYKKRMRSAVGLVSITALVSAGTCISAPVHAQAFSSVVDVCTGVSLPRSEVTDLLGEVLVPVVTPIEGTVNDVLGVVSIIPIVGTLFPDLDIDLTTILNDAAAGAPLSLQVIDNNGTILGASDACNTTSDGYTLNTEGGISIGGNAITGLGANGQAANAMELDAIAFGNNAITLAGATGAIALGSNALASAANSVALGAGSVADRGAQTAYAAPGLTGTFNSVGSVSVGSAGNLRQITNVAPGSAATDAATVGQVQGVLAAVTALDALAIQYDDTTQASVTFGGAGGTQLTNVASGVVGAASSDAVNGSQLFATNQTVADNTADIATLQTGVATHTAQITTLQTGLAGVTADVTTLQADVATHTADIAALQSTTIQYDDATHASLTLDGAGGTTISNVANGTLSAVSTDAVNGSQLFTTNQAVAGHTANIAANTSDIAALQTGAVQYDDASQAGITLGGAGGTAITNLAAGALSAGSTDAVNGSQLFATNQAVATNTADIATLQTGVAANTATIGTLQTGVATHSAQITTLQTGLAGVTADVTSLQADVATHTADIAALQSATIQYDDATHASLTLDGAGGTTISNVANGALSAASSDAVNGSQLFATNQAVAANSTDISNLDGRVTVNEGDITALKGRATTSETNIAALQTDVSDVDARVTVNEGDISTLDGRVTVNEGDITALKGRATTSETNIATLQTDVSHVDARVTVNEGDITILRNQIADVPVYYVDDATRTTRSAVVTDTIALASASGGAAALTNVAAGALSASSTDAVNGSQLYATNQRVDQNTADIQTLNNNIAGSTVVAVQYSNPDNPTVSNGGTVTNDVALVGADGAAPVALHNVARGSMPNDAVNVGQFEAGLNGVLTDSMAYTDRQLSVLAFDLKSMGSDMRRMREEAFAGTASAMAVASIPQTMEAGGRMIGGAIGHYRGETAFALGASSTFNDGRGVAKIGATLDGRGHGGFSAGAGFSF